MKKFIHKNLFGVILLAILLIIPYTTTARQTSNSFSSHIVVAEAKTSIGKSNALKRAHSYLETMPFSKNGLIKQLKFDGFTTKEAKYAANKCGANWNKQAKAKAKHYLRTMPFSKNGLIKQLKFDGFTSKQSKYGVNHCKANWNKQAVKKAKQYLKIMSFSKSGLISQLKFDGFTSKQAKYAAKKVGYK